VDVVRLHEQTDSRHRVDQGLPRRSLKERALSSRRFGPYNLQAASAAAPDAAATGWAQVVGRVGRAGAGSVGMSR
jgi:predicted RNA polymerase sigma factor